MRRGKRFGELHDVRNEGSLARLVLRKGFYFEHTFLGQLSPNASEGFRDKLSPNMKSTPEPYKGVTFYYVLFPNAFV